ncbi:MAG: hypothetical protein ACYST6_10560 [Planctomycetota bacterium]|jgi:DnaJ-class molecular chaperone
MIQAIFRNAPKTTKMERLEILSNVTAEILNAVREIESETGAAVVAVSIEIDYSTPHRYTVLNAVPAAVCDVLTDNFEDCEHCDGTGRVTTSEYWKRDGSPAGHGHGHRVEFSEDCERCDGTGRVDPSQCNCGELCELPHRGGVCGRCGGAV